MAAGHLATDAGGRQAACQLGFQRRVGDHRQLRMVPGTKVDECLDLPMGSQHRGAKALRMPRDHVERTATDGAGGAENGNLVHLQISNNSKPAANTGSAANTLSSRSIRPPWPGKMVPESFTWACRFIKLSSRSPTIEIATVTAASNANATS